MVTCLGALSIFGPFTRVAQVYTYVCVYLLYINITNTGHHLSTYYFIVGLLNTKYNIALIFLVSLIFLNFLKKGPMKWPLIVFIVLLYVNVVPGTVHTNTSSNILAINTVNTNLLNGLMLIHPVLLYLFYVLYLMYVYKLLYLGKPTDTKPTPNTNSQWVGLILSASYTSLILGCFWAEQELSWGGWWSWDFVELITLNFFIYTVCSIHNPTKTFSGNSPSILILILLSSVLVVRFNIINSIHNFISIESQNQYFYYIMLFLLCSIISLLVFYRPLNGDRYFSKFTNAYKINYVVTRFNKVGFSVYSNVLNPKTLFVCSVWIFYLLFLYNVLGANLNFIKYNTQTNTKHILITVLLFTLMWYFVKNTNFFLGVVLIIMLCLITKSISFVTLCIISPLWQKLRFLNLNTKFNKLIWKVHFALLFYLLVCMSQTYIFNTSDNIHKSVSLEELKSNYIIVVQRSTNLHSTIELFIDSLLNLDSIGGNPSKQVFEKEIKLLLNTFYETYSYNLQNLHQPIGLCILIALAYLLCNIIHLLVFVKVTVL